MLQYQRKKFKKISHFENSFCLPYIENIEIKKSKKGVMGSKSGDAKIR